MKAFWTMFGGTMGIIIALAALTFCCCGGFTVLSVIGSHITVTPIP
jgi:hypothetical protein